MQSFHLESDYTHAVEAEEEEHMKRESVDLWQQAYSNPHSTVPYEKKTKIYHSSMHLGWLAGHKYFINTMKKFLLAAMVLMASVVANAQNEVGQISVAPVVGINLSNLTKLDNTKMKFGIAAGAVAEYGVSEKFGVSLGLLYSQQGCKFDGGGKYNMDYLNIPILAQYYVWNGLAIKAGVQPGCLVSAKAKGDGESTSIKEYCNKFDVAIPVGLSYEYKNIVLDARYNIGLTKTFKKTYTDKKSNNSVFQFTLGYKFKI